MKPLILKNNYGRFMQERAYLLITAIVLIVMTIATAYIVTMKTPQAEIGVTPSAATLLRIKPTKNQSVAFKAVTPGKTYNQDLILGKYDAYVTKKNGHYKVTTVRSSSLKKQLSTYLNTGVYQNTAQSKESIFKIFLSVLAMSTMILSLILYKFYFDDRNGMDKRIYLSGISTLSYICQHFSFNVLVLSGLTLPITVIFLPLFGITLSLGLLAAIVLVDIFSAAFGLMISTLTEKNQGALIIGTILTVLTLMISGALFTVKANTFQDRLQYMFIQHYTADLGKYLDGSGHQLGLPLAAITAYTAIFLVIAWIFQKKRSTD